MEKIKKKFTGTKIAASLGLIAYAILAIYDVYYLIESEGYIFSYSFVVCISYLVGIITNIVFFIYFALVYKKLKQKQDDIKPINKFLLHSFVILTIIKIGLTLFYIIMFKNFGYALGTIMNVMTCWYILGMTKSLKNEINNKTFTGLMLAYFVYGFIGISNQSILSIIFGILALMYLPFFYNYYNVLNKKNETSEINDNLNEKNNELNITNNSNSLNKNKSNSNKINLNKVNNPIVEKENENSIQQVSVADEIRKFKQLLDDGIISQEEFDAKKKKLLNL